MPTISFQATLYTIDASTILRLPDEASAHLPSRGQVMVKGTLNGVDFKTPLEPDGKGSHWFKVDRALLDSAGAAAGDTVALEIESIKEWPEPPIPEDWQQALEENPEVRKLWDAITPLARWDWIRWIGSSKQPETRRRHIEVGCSKLKAGTRRPCCFNRAMCCDPYVSKNGVLLEPAQVTA